MDQSDSNANGRKDDRGEFSIKNVAGLLLFFGLGFGTGAVSGYFHAAATHTRRARDSMTELWTREQSRQDVREHNGASSAFPETAIHLTPDEESPLGMNVLWCGSSIAGWRSLQDFLQRDDVVVEGAEDQCARLNAISDAEDWLPKAQYVYSRAGVFPEIVQQMEGERSWAFPPESNYFASAEAGDLVLYSSVYVLAEFLIPFNDLEEPLAFRSESGETTRLRSFGISKEDEDEFLELRRQIDVLFYDWETPVEDARPYALNLCRFTDDIEIIVAVVPRQATLRLCWEEIKRRSRDFEEARFNEVDSLAVPNISFSIDHVYEELGGVIAEDGRPLRPPVQHIDFMLDRGGAIMRSDLILAVGPAARHFDFDRPFLVAIKRRDADFPFFMLWVENDELLVPWS